ncbi:putative dsRNA-binding protein [Deinococcus sp. Marseille-Q6407]|uniref:putative dsRNA-binding protein n=1 Tax=Deinococcus sp. Marseille-Q6407 TaxID=2969223 RepID=UPI0021C0ED2B|nr:double-stranded RNA binding motif domain-containing protein [Deinococcus sp. Marseille-Q6407]
MAENPKGDLIAALAAQGLTPDFRLQESGPPHAPSFLTEVWCDGQRLGQGTAGSKREAERQAARQALDELSEEGARMGRPEAATSLLTAAASTPWPLHPAVLAEALAVADSRLALGAPLPEVARAAAGLYRELLAELGHAAAPDQVGPEQTG